MSEKTKINPRQRSTEVTEGYERAPARSMLRAIGFTDDDFNKPQVGVAFLLWAILEGSLMSVVIAALPAVVGTLAFAARLGENPLRIALAVFWYRRP